MDLFVPHSPELPCWKTQPSCWVGLGRSQSGGKPFSPVDIFLVGHMNVSWRQGQVRSPGTPNTWPLSPDQWSRRAVLSCTPGFEYQMKFRRKISALDYPADSRVQIPILIQSRMFFTIYLKAGLELLEVPDGHHNFVQALLNLCQGVTRFQILWNLDLEDRRRVQELPCHVNQNVADFLSKIHVCKVYLFYGNRLSLSFF